MRVCTRVLSVLERMRPKDHEFQASLETLLINNKQTINKILAGNAGRGLA